MAHIAGIVIAAGSSKRFGRNKLLEKVASGDQEKSILGITLTQWLKVFDRMNVVIRPEHVDLLSTEDIAAFNTRIDWVICERADLGMGASIASGVRATSDAHGWLIGLGDMPLLSALSIAQVKASLMRGAEIAATYYHGRRGHPVGFSSRHAEALINLNGDVGARHLLETHAHLIEKVPVMDIGAIMDIDTSEDLQAITTYLNKEGKHDDHLEH
jgi:molybdenum cofactor cytidylyltransferase